MYYEVTLTWSWSDILEVSTDVLRITRLHRPGHGQIFLEVSTDVLCITRLH